MSLQRNSALSMRTICFSKPVSELVLQTGLTRPRSWTEEVSDLGRGLFSFEFPAQIETSASREVMCLCLFFMCMCLSVSTVTYQTIKISKVRKFVSIAQGQSD